MLHKLDLVSFLACDTYMMNSSKISANQIEWPERAAVLCHKKASKWVDSAEEFVLHFQHIMVVLHKQVLSNYDIHDIYKFGCTFKKIIISQNHHENTCLYLYAIEIWLMFSFEIFMFSQTLRSL